MSNMQSHNQPDIGPIVIRRATDDDALALERLSQLEGLDVPPEPLLVAEVDGIVQAALSIETGAAIADPFKPTANLVSMLESHARPVEPVVVPTGVFSRGVARRAPWPA